jgi:integrase
MGSLRLRGTTYWIRYNRAGRRHEESAHTDVWETARDLLRRREGKIAEGAPITAKMGQLRMGEALQDVIRDYRINGKRSLKMAEQKITKHLIPYFGARRATAITATNIRQYIEARQAATEIVRGAYTRRGADGTERQIKESRRPVDRISNAEINRELALLKRAFNLALQSGKILAKPYMSMLKESNARAGFFEPEAFESVVRHLPEDLRGLVRFGSLTGWRIKSEVQTLQWSQVDDAAGEVRLNPGTTKNSEGRVFPITDAMRTILDTQREASKQLKRAGTICPWVFFRMVAEGRGGPKTPVPILSITHSWNAACRAAGCPGRIPHDLRRTAVRNFVRAGIPERVAMQLSGHKTPSVFARYNIVSGGDLKDAARRLNGATVPAMPATGTR